ncbi:hypothetical protein Pfo_007984 [Paulownia fortunei]|nr:hypothetical protein Pfo_007984 [Paulownia fortunei]
MQVVQSMGEIHTNMGNILIILYTNGVWLVQGIAQKSFHLRHCWPSAFLFDIILQFFVAYRDSHSYKMIYKRTPIALRYLKSHFIIDRFMPWDIIYTFWAVGEKEEVRYLLWIRLIQVHKVTGFFQRMEKDI